jgi:hypothetical protein
LLLLSKSFLIISFYTNLDLIIWLYPSGSPREIVFVSFVPFVVNFSFLSLISSHEYLLQCKLCVLLVFLNMPFCMVV